MKDGWNSEMTTTTTEEKMGRTASDKERTKLRERQRRSITTKIFHGLRKHGGYHLPPRADINDVLRALAMEAGWVVEPDGTTYRSSSTSSSSAAYSNATAATTTTTTTTKINNDSHFHHHSCCCCNTCIAGKRSGTPTPTSSYAGGVGGGGDCSTTASPRHATLPLGNLAGPNNSLYFTAGGSSSQIPATDLAIYFGMPYGDHGVTLAGVHQSQQQQQPSMMFPHHLQQVYFQETRASNQNTPVGSPQRRT